MMCKSETRYAIYFTPRPSSGLARFGDGILGYEAATGVEIPRLDVPGIGAAELASATRTPQRYGFHATLVAPFYLGDISEAELIEAHKQLCGTLEPASLGRLRPQALYDFVALVPAEAEPKVDRLTQHCVEFFDNLRAPLDAHDFARRNTSDLTSRQRANLERWGYPYVFDEFRFHMSLTGPLDGADCDRFVSALDEAFGPLADQVVEIEALSLMRQSNSAARFEILTRCDLNGTAD